MKTDDEKLKEVFNKNLGQSKGAPDFDPMWEQAAGQNKKKSFFWLKMAAGVALILTLGTLVIRHRGRDQENRGVPLAAWTEPTVGLQKDIQVTALSQWSSPTDFLLTGNKNRLK